MPEVDSGSGITLLVMGVVYAGGFLIAAWWFVRRLSRKDQQFQDEDPSGGNTETTESQDQATIDE